MQGPLSQAVAGVCVALLPQVSAPARAGVEALLARLDSPLQLAVAGRIKSGKSTLVNALIGRRVAPTDIGECTRLVTRFTYGTVDRIEVVFTDGRRSTVPFAPDGGIPADLGLDLAAVSHVEAFLTSGLLTDITVIDTPGLGSTDASSVSRTETLLAGRPRGGSTGRSDPAQPAGASRTGRPDVGDGGLDDSSAAAVAGAEAVIYVFTQSVRADDTAALAAFTAATAARDAGPVNALAVLNKADTVPPESVAGSDGSVGSAARLVAAAQATVLRPRVADVVPMIGLLAETAETGAFTAGDADALRALAELPAALTDALLLATDLFATVDGPVDPPTRVRLLQLLDLFGIREALAHLRAEPQISAGELRRRLLDASGLAELRRRLGEIFAIRADGIKAGAAMAGLSAIAATSEDWGERQRIHDAIEVLLQRPEAHQLRMLEVLTLVSNGSVVLGDDLTSEVLRLGSSNRPDEQLGRPGGRVADLQAIALERANWWRSFASFGATPAQSRVAHVVHRSYFLLWQDLKGAVRAAAAGGLGRPPLSFPPFAPGLG